MLEKNLVDLIRITFSRGKSIRRNLPQNSKLVIDQKLPYICVYRFTGTPDPYISSLLKTQGAYLIANTELDIKSLLHTLVEVSIEDFKSFMIVEIWNETTAIHKKSIRILHPEDKVAATIDTFEKGFNEFNQLLPGIKVLLEDTRERHPESLEPLLALDFLKRSGTLLIGIAIQSLFRDEEGKNYYPLFFRKIRRKFAEVIKLAAFEFVRIQSDNKFEHYLMLGKTRLDNLVRSADRRLSAVSEKMEFILRVTPVNSASEWESFKKNNYSKLPHFTYRLISLDPELEKRKLFNIPIENIEHPTLAFLLRDKRMELEKQLIMLEERGTEKFLHTSQSIYGPISNNLRAAALSLLNDTIPNEQMEYNTVNAVDFARAAKAEMDKYRKNFPQINLTVKVKDDVSGLLVSQSELSVGKDLNISEGRLEALIQHEVGTHILTYCNGHLQPLQLMYAGFAGYEEIQEGMAVLSEFFVEGLNRNRLKLLAARVMAVDSLIHGADFIETYRILCNEYGFSGKTSFNIAMRVHRGGGYTKDAIYLKGLLDLLEFIKDGGDITNLYGGKFALEHLPLMEELLHLRILKKPYLPAYLTSDSAKKKIEKIKNGIELKELIAIS
ncbi:MAG: tyrosine/phenylalanine carboxypeptidase domain-containing protein [Ginsengibacter sp.]